MRFPLITIGDIVNAQRALVERLGVTRRLVAIGGSIGGFQALEWATRHPELVSASRSDRGHRGARRAGHRDERDRPARDHGRSRLARRAYAARAFSRPGLGDRAHGRHGDLPQPKESMDLRFGRNPATRPVLYPSFGPTFDVEGYLHYHGDALVERFDANSYLYLTRAMDLYDVGRDGGEATWLRQIEARSCSSASAPTGSSRPARSALGRSPARARQGRRPTHELDSPHGHDAFLKEWEQMTEASLVPSSKRVAAGEPSRR